MLRSLFLSCLALPLLTGIASAQEPTVGASSVMTFVKFFPNRIMQVSTDLHGVFMPKNTVEDGMREIAPEDQVFVSLHKAGGAELIKVRMMVFAGQGVYSGIRTAGAPIHHEFTEPGDYEFRVSIGSKVISTMPFSAVLAGGDDPFEPSQNLSVHGPWDDLACLLLEEKSDPEKIVKLRIWPSKRTGEDELWDALISLNGEVLYETRPAYVAEATPKQHEIEFVHPKAAGADWVRLKDLLKVDGNYTVTMRRDGEAFREFSFVVKGGKLAPHKRSAMSYQPHTGFLCPREMKGLKTRDLVWMSAGGSSGAAPVAASAKAATATAASADDLARWQVRSEADANAPLAITHTTIPARFDAAIAAGDGIIAFGTGGYNGLEYMKVGETKSRSIPEGQSFRAGFFGVCGKKIILVNGSHLAVFDTETEKLTKIPEDVVHLATPVKEMNQNGPLDVSGFLVATVNDPTKTADRKVVKVLDLSGPEPKVITLSNSEFQGKECTDIAVDAETGIVAVSCKKMSSIFTAPVVDRGQWMRTDLSGHDGVGDCRMIASGGRVAYRDAAGSAKLRILFPATNQIMTLATVGPTIHGYALNGNTYALAGTKNNGSSYAWFTGKLPEGSADLGERLGETSEAGNGQMGFGQSCVIAPDGNYFVAGYGKGGLGSGEFLYGCIDGKWTEFLGTDGQALPACDLVLGDHLIAFRSGTVKDTTISYATFGNQIKQ